MQGKDAMIVQTSKAKAKVSYRSWIDRQIGFLYGGREIRLGLTDDEMRAFPAGTEIEVIVAIRHAEPDQCFDERKTIEYPRPKTRGDLVRALHDGRPCEVATYIAGSTRALIDNWLEPPPYTIRASENKGWVVFEPESTITP